MESISETTQTPEESANFERQKAVVEKILTEDAELLERLSR